MLDDVKFLISINGDSAKVRNRFIYVHCPRCEEGWYESIIEISDEIKCLSCGYHFKLKTKYKERPEDEERN